MLSLILHYLQLIAQEHYNVGDFHMQSHCRYLGTYCNAVQNMQKQEQIKQPIAISQFNGQLLKIQNISYNIFVNNILFIIRYKISF